MKFRPHYGWVIASVLFTCFTLTVGILQYSFGVFITPLEDEFGWTRTEVNVSLSLFAMTGVLALAAGPLLDRFGSVRVMAVSYLLISMSFLPRPWMTELWEFYALNLLMYAGMPGAIMLPVGKLIGTWFVQGRGRAIGLTAMGANFGGFIFSAQTRTLIDYTDWRTTFFIFGLMFLVLIPLIMLTIRDKPRERLSEAQETLGMPIAAPAPEGMSARAAIRTRAFVLVAVGLLLASVPYQSLLTQIIPHLEGEGMSRDQAAWMLSVLAIFGMVGKVLLGWLTEKFAARKVFVGSLLFQVLGILILINAGASPLVLLFVPIYGIAFGGMGSLITLIPLDTFGTKEFATIFGFLSFLMLPSALIGPPIVGYLFDQMQTYTVAFYGVSALLVVSAVAFWFAKPPPWRKAESEDPSRDVVSAAT